MTAKKQNGMPRESECAPRMLNSFAPEHGTLLNTVTGQPCPDSCKWCKAGVRRTRAQWWVAPTREYVVRFTHHVQGEGFHPCEDQQTGKEDGPETVCRQSDGEKTDRKRKGRGA